MKIFKTIAGIVCVLLGGLWALQGLNVIANSAMSGQTQWLVIGSILAVVGLGLLYQTHVLGRRL